MPNTEIPPFFTTSIKCASTSLFLIVSISVFFILEAFAMASTLSLFKSVFSSAAKLDRKIPHLQASSISSFFHFV